MESLPHKVAPALRRLLPRGSRVLVATSGGPDSQVLLDLLAARRDSLGLSALWACGVDHGLRPAAAGELRLAEALARRHDVEFFVRRVQVPPGNVLAAARRARYAALEALADELGADRIAVAHTATDQAETVLLQAIRYDGFRGRLGMPAKRGRVVRPLLEVTRDEVAAYARERDLASAADPSNTDPRRARARLRAEVLPVLRALNPRAERALALVARASQRDDALLQSEALRWLAGHGDAGPLPLVPLTALDPAVRERVLAAWLTAGGARPDRRSLGRLAALVARGRGGARLRGAVARIDRDQLWLERAVVYCLSLPIPGRVELPGRGFSIVSRLDEASTRGYGGNSPFPQPTRGIALDADRLQVDLAVRGWEAGDRLEPWGMSGSIKVGDLFTNAKVPRALRAGWPVVEHGGCIVWVVGLRRGCEAPITPSTRRVVTLEIAERVAEH